MDQYTTLTEVAKSLRISPHRVIGLLTEAGVPIVRLSPRRTRIRQADVDAWLEDCQITRELEERHDD